jgi:hypothetical protein
MSIGKTVCVVAQQAAQPEFIAALADEDTASCRPTKALTQVSAVSWSPDITLAPLVAYSQSPLPLEHASPLFTFAPSGRRASTSFGEESICLRGLLSTPFRETPGENKDVSKGITDVKFFETPGLRPDLRRSNHIGC